MISEFAHPLAGQRPRIYGMACLILTSSMTASATGGTSMMPSILRGRGKQKMMSSKTCMTMIFPAMLY
jgi:hypothetical protein